MRSRHRCLRGKGWIGWGGVERITVVAENNVLRMFWSDEFSLFFHNGVGDIEQKSLYLLTKTMFSQKFYLKPIFLLFSQHVSSNKPHNLPNREKLFSIPRNL